MSGLRSRLVTVWLVATLPPLALTLWLGHTLLQRSLRQAPVAELERTAALLEETGRRLYQNEREALRREAASGRVTPEKLDFATRASWPRTAQEFWRSDAEEAAGLGGRNGNELHLYIRKPDGVWLYRRSLGVELETARRGYAAARERAEEARRRGGLSAAFVALTALPWMAALAVLVWAVRRMSRPVQDLTAALRRVGAGDLTARVEPRAAGELGEAQAAFNAMAGELESSRERLLYVTRLESWQALARKMAHEVKNSLTPIRLTVEEIAARNGSADARFQKQASQIIVDEVASLERRVRAFSELAAEPPVELSLVDAHQVIRERIALLGGLHPGVAWTISLDPHGGWVRADEDLLKAVFTNLLKNAVEACGPTGEVRVLSWREAGRMLFEVNDSGPGLSPAARRTLFEPGISFKPGGMGIGLSIARKSALLCGGDVAESSGKLPGACFRVELEEAHAGAHPDR